MYFVESLAVQLLVSEEIFIGNAANVMWLFIFAPNDHFTCIYMYEFVQDTRSKPRGDAKPVRAQRGR